MYIRDIQGKIWVHHGLIVFELQHKRQKILMKPSEVKGSVNHNQSLCRSWVKVRFSSLPENMTGQNNFSVGSRFAVLMRLFGHCKLDN